MSRDNKIIRKILRIKWFYFHINNNFKIKQTYIKTYICIYFNVNTEQFKDFLNGEIMNLYEILHANIQKKISAKKIIKTNIWFFIKF